MWLLVIFVVQRPVYVVGFAFRKYAIYTLLGLCTVKLKTKLNEDNIFRYRWCFKSSTLV